MDKSTWKEFVRIAGGVFLIGVGISIVGGSQGEVWLLITGFALAAVGVGLLFIK